MNTTLNKKEKKVLGRALRLLFDKDVDFETLCVISELAEKFETKNVDEIKNDLQFLTLNPY